MCRRRCMDCIFTDRRKNCWQHCHVLPRCRVYTHRRCAIPTVSRSSALHRPDARFPRIAASAGAPCACKKRHCTPRCHGVPLTAPPVSMANSRARLVRALFFACIRSYSLQNVSCFVVPPTARTTRFRVFRSNFGVLERRWARGFAAAEKKKTNE